VTNGLAQCTNELRDPSFTDKRRFNPLVNEYRYKNNTRNATVVGKRTTAVYAAYICIKITKVAKIGGVAKGQ